MEQGCGSNHLFLFLSFLLSSYKEQKEKKKKQKKDVKQQKKDQKIKIRNPSI